MVTSPPNAPPGPRARGDRVVRTADAIVGLHTTYARPVVFFLKTLDRISVSLHGPFGLLVSAPSQPGFTYETVALDGMSASEKAIDLAGCLDIVIHRPGRVLEDATARTAALQAAQTFVAELSYELNKRRIRGGLSRLQEALLSGFREASSSPTRLDANPIAELSDGISEFEVSGRLAVFFEGLEKFIDRQDFNISLPAFDGSKRCSRFLIFHRFIDEAGHLRTTLHLLKNQAEYFSLLQRDALESVVDKADDPHPAEAVTSMLASAFSVENWLLESAVSTGTTCWIDWPWHASTNVSSATIKAKRLFAALRDIWSCDPQLVQHPADDFGALVVPVHVGGVPWLALVGIFPVRDAEDDPAPEYFYRDILPYLTTTVRQLAEQTYLSEVRACAKLVLRGPRPGVAELNAGLRRLSSAFPYPMATVANEEGAHPIRLGARSASLVLSTTTPLSPSRVSYFLLDPEYVREALDIAQHDVDADRVLEMQQRMSSYVDIGHTLKNLGSATGWGRAWQQVTVLSRNFDEVERQGFSPGMINRIRVTLADADSSLSMFWMVEGLGHFIRLAGAQSGNFEWTKFAKWLEGSWSSGARTGDVETWVAAYAKSIFAFGKVICFSWGWPSLTVRGLSGVEAVWEGETPHPFSIKDMHFPPFAKGSEGGFVFAFSLTEPILNAVRATNAVPPERLAGCQRVPIQIEVAKGQSTDDEIVVSIVNISATDIPETLSGWESTKNMLRDLGIGRFDPVPIGVPLADGLFEITATIRFFPEILADTIRRRAGGKYEQP